MGRTRVVLAVVAAMVTVLVFAVPAFAVPNLGESNPPGPGGQNNESPENIGGQSADKIAAEDSIGDVATDYVVHAQEFDVPAGHHLLESQPLLNQLVQAQDPQHEPLENAGDLIQYCQENPNALACNFYETKTRLP